jgi:hypothetical protein
VRSVDAFWHLAAGRWMLDHGELLRHDPFRFTSGGAAWVDHEWGFQLLVAAVERAGGIPAIVAARAALLAALAALLWTLARRRGAPAAAAAAITLVVTLGVRGRFFVRPEVASICLLAVLLALLEAGRGGRRYSLAAVPLLAVVWVNLHPGALVAPMVVLAYLVGWRSSSRRGNASSSGPRGASTIAADAATAPWAARRPDQPGWLTVFGLPAATLLALLANPWGWHLFAVPLRISTALAAIEATNPDWSPLWRAPRPGFVLWMALLVALFATLRRRGLSVDLPNALVIGVLAVLGVAGVRHQPLAWVASGPWAAAAVASLANSGARWRLARLAPATLAWLACGLAVAWCIAPPSRGPLRPRGSPPRFGTGIQPGLFPAAAVDRVRELPGLGNLYNDVAFGGYLAWRMFPPRQVFVDSRNELAPELLVELSAARRDSRRWQALLERWAIDGAIVRYDDRPLPVFSGGGRKEHTISALWFPREQFALVHWDDVAMLFVRRRPDREAFLARREYRFVQPEDWRATLLAAARDPRLRDGVAADLRRRLAEDPTSERALRLQAALAELDALVAR